jgi:membrane dipeptidase
MPVIDGHNDLPMKLRARAGYDVGGLRDGRPDFHTDIPRLRSGGVGAQFWSVYVPSDLSEPAAVVATMEQVDAVYRMAAAYPEDLVMAYTADDVERAVAGGRIASLLGIEGGHSLATSLGVLRSFARLGVRYVTLTHNNNTSWADSAAQEPAVDGLNEAGRAIVREMQRIGVLVDLSHVAPVTMRAALDVAFAPVIFSHSSARAITDHRRNVPDDVLTRLRDNGGVVQVTFVPLFVSAEVIAWTRAAAAERRCRRRPPRRTGSRRGWPRTRARPRRSRRWPTTWSTPATWPAWTTSAWAATSTAPRRWRPVSRTWPAIPGCCRNWPTAAGPRPSWRS